MMPGEIHYRTEACYRCHGAGVVTMETDSDEERVSCCPHCHGKGTEVVPYKSVKEMDCIEGTCKDYAWISHIEVT
jgi:DnaJ-class molecular chaperone